MKWCVVLTPLTNSSYITGKYKCFKIVHDFMTIHSIKRSSNQSIQWRSGELQRSKKDALWRWDDVLWWHHRRTHHILQANTSVSKSFMTSWQYIPSNDQAINRFSGEAEHFSGALQRSNSKHYVLWWHHRRTYNLLQANTSQSKSFMTSQQYIVTN